MVLWSCFGQDGLSAASRYSDLERILCVSLCGGFDPKVLTIGTFTLANEAIRPASIVFDRRFSSHLRRSGIVWYPYGDCNRKNRWSIWGDVQFTANCPADSHCPGHVHLSDSICNVHRGCRSNNGVRFSRIVQRLLLGLICFGHTGTDRLLDGGHLLANRSGENVLRGLGTVWLLLGGGQWKWTEIGLAESHRRRIELHVGQ